MNTLEIMTRGDQDTELLTYNRPVRRMPSAKAAEELARALLESLGNRWAHTQAVAARADGLTPAVTPVADRSLLVVAACWHDLGYAPALRDTGCHQIDGARYLEREGYPDRLVALVAHHSAATCEAEERGLLAELDVWPREKSPVADALWMADMTTGPAGEELAHDERLSEILTRYERASRSGGPCCARSRQSVLRSSARGSGCRTPTRSEASARR